MDPRNPQRSEMFVNVVGGAMLAKNFILDDTGKLEQMNASVGYGDDEPWILEMISGRKLRNWMSFPSKSNNSRAQR